MIRRNGEEIDFSALPQAKIEKFWSLVEKTDTCWLWRGRQHNAGYGVFDIGEYPQLTHRVSWALAFGSFDETLFVCHRCDVRLCVRPDHLFLGTQRDNIRDAVSKNRMARGERHGLRLNPEASRTAKISMLDAEEIRRLVKEGVKSADIRKRFGIANGQISNIVRNECWKTDQGSTPGRVARGEIHGMARLTSDRVVEMRALRETGQYTLADLSKLFGVSIASVSLVVNRKTWTHI